MNLPADLITPREAARLVKAHLGTVHRWIHTGKLRAWRRGEHRYLVSRAEVEGMLSRVAPLPELDDAADVKRRNEVAMAALRAMGLKV